LDDTAPPDEQLSPPPSFKPDEDEIAIDLAEDWAGKVAYFHNAWWVYEHGCWIERGVHEVKRAIRVFLRSYRMRGIGVTQRLITSLAQMLSDDVYMPDRKLIDCGLDSRRYVNLTNGLFDLETLELKPHNPDLYMTTQLHFPYDPEADCPLFRRYLYTSLVLPNGKTDQDMVFLALEALAYSMTARTDMKASFWLVGEPDSGKSTLIAIIRKLMGNLHTTIDLNQLATNRFLLSGIVGKRVVTFTEAETNTILPDALYKAMVGGQDEIYVDVKNKPGISFVPEAKFWWGMNRPPRISDRTAATFNRLRVLPFTRTIPVNERIGGLSDQIAQNEASGVFNWLLIGWRRLLNAGEFTRPALSETWRDDYRRNNDTESQFIEECAVYDPNGKVQASDLYTRYKWWCEESGFKPKNKFSVAEEWRRLGLTSSKTSYHYWHGITLRSQKNI
jgi:putative DNA primase/helicase